MAAAQSIGADFVVVGPDGALADGIVDKLAALGIAAFVILGATDERAPKGFAPIAIGFALVVLNIVAVPVSGAGFNPARSLATAVYGGPHAMAQLWVFIVFPIVGGLIAGLTYNPLFGRKNA